MDSRTADVGLTLGVTQLAVIATALYLHAAWGTGNKDTLHGLVGIAMAMLRWATGGLAVAMTHLR